MSNQIRRIFILLVLAFGVIFIQSCSIVKDRIVVNIENTHNENNDHYYTVYYKDVSTY